SPVSHPGLLLLVAAGWVGTATTKNKSKHKAVFMVVEGAEPRMGYDDNVCSGAPIANQIERRVLDSVSKSATCNCSPLSPSSYALALRQKELYPPGTRNLARDELA